MKATEEQLGEEELRILENIKSDPVRQLCFGAYLGEICQGCGKPIDSFEDMMRTVWWPHEKGRIGHKRCYLAALAAKGAK